ncbi:hypothetical protein O3S80_15105 [Streptomyces sp. Lzd4kr]|nr:hypothetical protein [Streptomyces sp. Lzd4kr]
MRVGRIGNFMPHAASDHTERQPGEPESVLLDPERRAAQAEEGNRNGQP